VVEEEGGGGGGCKMPKEKTPMAEKLRAKK